MTQDRKYFGMTVQQVGILGGLAVVVCLLFGGTAFLAVRRAFSPEAPASTPVVQSTSTPFVLPTLASTGTPTQVPYEQLIPAGWEQHRTTLVELWLPAGFRQTDTSAAPVILEQSALRELSLAGTSPSSSQDFVQVSVAYEPLTDQSLEALLDSRLSNLPVDVKLAERRKVLVNNTEVHRIMFERQNGNVYTDDLVFIFLDGRTIWYIKYTAGIKDFFEMLPVFDDSVKTFRVVK